MSSKKHVKNCSKNHISTIGQIRVSDLKKNIFVQTVNVSGINQYILFNISFTNIQDFGHH